MFVVGAVAVELKAMLYLKPPVLAIFDFCDLNGTFCSLASRPYVTLT